MTDEEFVFWYIKKICIFTGLKFRKKYLNDEVTIINIIEDVRYSLSIDKLNNKTISKELLDWYNKEQKNANNDILDYIRFKYKVTLGPTSWVISRMNGTIIKKKDIVSDLKGKYDSEFIKNIVSQWFENELIRITEQSTLHFN
jgi:hypothetical protein